MVKVTGICRVDERSWVKCAYVTHSYECRSQGRDVKCGAGGGGRMCVCSQECLSLGSWILAAVPSSTAYSECLGRVVWTSKPSYRSPVFCPPAGHPVYSHPLNGDDDVDEDDMAVSRAQAPRDLPRPAECFTSPEQTWDKPLSGLSRHSKKYNVKASASLSSKSELSLWRNVENNFQS